MKKIMVVLLVAMVGVAFGGKFEVSEYKKFVEAKDYAGLKAYIVTNNEGNSLMYTLALLKVKGYLDKTLTKANFVQQVEKQCKANNLKDFSILTVLYQARNFVPDLTPQEAALATKNYYMNKNMTYALPVMVNAYCALNQYDNCINYIKKFKRNRGSQFTALFSHYKKMSNEQKIALINVIGSDPVLYISTAKDLTYVIEMVKTLSDPKYDEVVKPFINKLNRAFYDKITESDDWKQAVVKLNLVIKSYGL